ncbi:MAG TPA: hypothetical protein ENK14_05435 [Caldithrix sp.]|nr:hypothetical protein [Caldithrix sp.]
MTIEILVKSDRSAEIYLWLEKTAGEDEKNALIVLGNSIRLAFPDRISVEHIAHHPVYVNEGLKMNIDNLNEIQQKLNFLDFRYSSSFFKQKYYLKLLLNQQMFQSAFFEEIAQNGFDKSKWQHLKPPEAVLEFVVKFPGICSATNLERTAGGYDFKISHADFMQYGGVIYFESYRFIPRVYITVFLIVVVLTVMLLKSARKLSDGKNTK